MVVTLDTHRLQALEQVGELLDGSQPIYLQVLTRAEAYRAERSRSRAPVAQDIAPTVFGYRVPRGVSKV